MNSKSFQKLLISTHKQGPPFVKLSRIFEPTTYNSLPRKSKLSFCKTELPFGDCELCGMHGDVVIATLGSGFKAFTRNGYSAAPEFNVPVCISCEAVTNTVTELQNNLQSAQNELDSIASGVNVVLNLRQSQIHTETQDVKAEYAVLASNETENIDIVEEFSLTLKNEESWAESSPDCGRANGRVPEELSDGPENLSISPNVNNDAVQADATTSSSFETSSRTTFKCTLCKMSFKTSFKLKSHIRTHRDGNTRTFLECCFCRQKFQHIMSLRTHYKTHKNKDYPGKCGECGKIMSSFDSLKLHHLWAHGTEEQKIAARLREERNRKSLDRKCHKCNKILSSRKFLKKHLIALHGSEKQKNAMKSKYRPYRQKVKEQKAPLHCYFCQKPFFASSFHREHLFTHTKEKPFKCSSCDVRTTTTTQLKLHNILYHGSEKEVLCLRRRMRNIVNRRDPLKCYFCQKPYRSFKALKHHVNSTHTKEVSPQKCAKCDKVFLTEKYLMRHWKSVCAPSKQKQEKYNKRMARMKQMLNCYFCGKNTTTLGYQELHLRGHTMEKPYKCSKCRKEYNNKAYAVKCHSVSISKK